MSKRDTFVLKASYFSAFRHKLNFEQKGRLLEAIYAYHLGEDYQSLLNDAAVDMAFSFIQEFAEMCKRNYDEISQKNSVNASKRWQKDTKDATASDRIQSHNSDAKRCLTDTDTDTNSDTDSLLKRECIEKKVAKASTTSSKKSSLINEWLLTLPPIWAELMRFWLKYKQERGESYKGLQGPKAALKNLQEFSNNDPAKAKAVIDQSIANNWAGLFNLKNDKNNGTDKKPFGQSYADRIIVPNREIFKTEQGTI